MSTRVGIVAEGPIDLPLLPSILHQIAEERAGVNSGPVNVADAFSSVAKCARGVMAASWNGPILAIVRVLKKTTQLPYAFYSSILLDRRTQNSEE